MPPLDTRAYSGTEDAVARVVGTEGGAVSEEFNLKSPGVGAPGRRPIIINDTTKCGCPQPAEQASAGLFDNWFDPIESALRDRVRGFIEELIRDELEGVLARPRYGRRAKEAGGVAGTAGYRHGGRRRTLTGRAAVQRGHGTT